MTHLFLAAFLSVFALSVYADMDGGGYGYRRTQADTHPQTMRARSEFDARTKLLFADSKRRHQVAGLKLSMNHRMIAQYGRGAASANAVLPVEIDRVVKLIGEARNQRDETVRYFKSLKSMERFSRIQIENAVDTLARVRTLHLDYWGYIGRVERIREFDRGSHTLAFFAKWNERASRYELNSEAAVRAQVLRGIIAGLNQTDSGWWPF